MVLEKNGEARILHFKFQPGNLHCMRGKVIKIIFKMGRKRNLCIDELDHILNSNLKASKYNIVKLAVKRFPSVLIRQHCKIVMVNKHDLA